MMYEDDTEADDRAQSMADLAAKGDIDFAQLGDQAKLPGLLQSLYGQQMRALAQQEDSAKKRFEAGEARIKERNQGPTQSEQLFMLSKALLAPRDYRGFAGTVGKISGAFSDISEAERKAREQRDAQLAALQDQYMETTGGYGVKRAQTAADLVKTAAPMFKKSTKAPFRYDLDAKGAVREIPNEVHRPKNRAEYEAIPLGEYYVVPSGPDAGKVIPKQ
jgi:hypothetical protein